MRQRGYHHRMIVHPVSRRAILAGGLAMSARAFAGLPSPGKPSSVPSIEQVAADVIGKNAYPGMAVAVSKDGVVQFNRGFGLANLETRTATTPQTVFRIGSLTKQFTAAAAIKLSAQGKLDLKGPVSAILPAFQTLKPFSTLELMHQTAGLHSDESDEPGTMAIKPRSQVELAVEIARSSKPFDFDPGTAWLYSNANYIVLGAVIEQVCKLPLAQAVKQLVFDPLGLRSTAFDAPDEVVTERASGYAQTGQSARPYAHAAYLDPSQAGGAGAMRARASELCDWHHRLLGGMLFDKSLVELMLKPGTLRDGRPSRANRFLASDAQYGDTDYACGFLVSGPSDPHPSILHYGAINGFCAVLQTYRRKQITFAALCNADIGPDAPFRGIRKAVMASWLA